VSSKSSRRITEAFVNALTYSVNCRSLLSTWLISAPTNAMSLPARNGTWMSASAEVRV
jgi:hypothetical protein